MPKVRGRKLRVERFSYEVKDARCLLSSGETNEPALGVFNDAAGAREFAMSADYSTIAVRVDNVTDEREIVEGCEPLVHRAALRMLAKGRSR